jgi:long-chain acyl-CoA synthetase
MAIDTSCIDGVNSLPEALFRAAEQYAAEPAQWHREQGKYLPVTYAQLVSRIRRVASGLIRAGVKAGDRVALLMENRPEWAVIDYAILSIGAVTVPLYCSYRPKDMSYVLNDSGAVAILTSTGKLLRNLLIAVDECPHLKKIYAMEGSPDSEQVETLISLESGDIEEKKLAGRMAGIRRDTLATLVYTSGTTANPKGVMLTHGNIIANLEAMPAVIDLSGGGNGDRMLSFLPLAHALERTGTHFLSYSFGLSIAFAQRPDTVAKNLAEAKPTIMIAVPRMLEVVRSRILARVDKQSTLKQALFHAYFKLARQDRPSAVNRLILKLLDRLIAGKVRALFGGRMRAIVSGGAPLSAEVAEFFELLKLPVLEGYGLSESAPLLAVNPMRDRRIGSVGPAARGVEIKIAGDGEILARGKNIMPGYWKNRKATKEALIDGWLHTGDIGVLSEDGYLTITDRKKDIIVNSGGENIAPQRIEGLLIVDALVDQAVVYGDQKPYLVALIVANQEACVAWAKEQGLPETDWNHLCASEVLRKHLQTTINATLKTLNPFEQVRRIHLLQEPFSVESGLLTPTMKIKRRKVYEQFGDVLESLYS